MDIARVPIPCDSDDDSGPFMNWSFQKITGPNTDPKQQDPSCNDHKMGPHIYGNSQISPSLGTVTQANLEVLANASLSVLVAGRMVAL